MKHEMTALGRRIDLNLCVVFEAVYRVRNLTAAGKTLSLSQPAVSHAISRLRWAFKDPLFVRTPRGVQPTALAVQIAPALIDGLARIRSALEGGRFDPARSTRSFTIAMADIAEAVHLPRVLKAMRSAPYVRLRAADIPAVHRGAALGDGRIDLALANAPAAGPIRHELLGEHGYKVVVRRNHPFIGRRITLSQFRRARHVLVISEGARRHGKLVRGALQSPDVDAEIAVQVSSFYPVAAIVAQSDLISVIPPGLAREMARTAPLRVLEPPLALPRIQIHLWWHERQHHDPGNAWLRDQYLRAIRPLYRIV